jgi:carboxymethylenebutenolidase
MARTETLTVAGSAMEVYVDEPAGAGPHPAMVVAHHRGALDAFTKKFVEDLAAAGFAAAAPSLFHRRPAGEDGMESIRNLNDKELVADLTATVAYLGDLASVRADAIGIVGHCMGGRVSFLGAAAIPSIAACGIFYGGNIMKGWGEGNPPLIESAGNIKCPVIGFFGNDDENPSPADVARIDQEFKTHGVTHTFHAYDGAGHAFQNFLSEAAYREDATKDAQAKLLAFLGKTLK